MNNIDFVRHLYDQVRNATPTKTVIEVLTDVEALVERIVKAAERLSAPTDAPKA